MSSKDSVSDELRFCRLTRLFSTIALTALIVLPVIVAFTNLSFLSHRGIYAVGALAVVGLVLASIDLPRYRRKEAAEDILHFYKNPHYWAMVVFISTLAVFAFLPPNVQRTPAVVVARAAELPRPKPPEFPSLEVSSVVLNGSRSSAIIDGQVVLVGEGIHNVILAEVHESKILARMGEATKEYSVGGTLTVETNR